MGLTDCISTGWGATTFDDPEYSDLLKKVELSIVNRDDCTNQINNLPRFQRKTFILYKDWMCVGGQERVLIIT